MTSSLKNSIEPDSPYDDVTLSRVRRRPRPLGYPPDGRSGANRATAVRTCATMMVVAGTGPRSPSVVGASLRNPRYSAAARSRDEREGTNPDVILRLGVVVTARAN